MNNRNPNDPRDMRENLMDDVRLGTILVLTTITILVVNMPFG